MRSGLINCGFPDGGTYRPIKPNPKAVTCGPSLPNCLVGRDAGLIVALVYSVPQVWFQWVDKGGLVQ